jgi:hypothetical protein
MRAGGVRISAPARRGGHPAARCARHVAAIGWASRYSYYHRDRTIPSCRHG